MAQMTLLEMVQDILSDLDSDTVDSYTDTVESQQVAQIINTTYFNMIDGRDWPHLYTFFRLESNTASGTRPTHMTLPSSVIDVEYIKYDCAGVDDVDEKFRKMTFMEPPAFMDMLHNRKSTASNIEEVLGNSGTVYNIYNDRPPQFFTTLGETTLIFDAYDGAVDDTLLVTKTQCYGKLYPSVTMDDDLLFPLPVNAYSMLLNEAKAVASLTLKQVPNPKAEQHSQTQRRRMSQAAWKLRNGITYPSYGRQGKK